MKTTTPERTMRERLGVDPAMSDRDLAARLYLQVQYLAGELVRRGAIPEDEVPQPVADRECSAGCTGDLPCSLRWIMASGSVADGMAKEA